MTYTDIEAHGPRPPAVIPTGIERILDTDDIIVSETDTKGIITYANNSFMRIAAYSEAELIGRPHNIVRHPSMPRCVFKLLWDTIATGRSIDAYVVNLAGDGAHYWVFAHVEPLYAPNGAISGYRSERQAPNRAALHAVAALYTQLTQAEYEAGGGRAGIEASTAQVISLLNSRNQTYDQFVHSLAG